MSVGIPERAFAPALWSNSEEKVCQTTILIPGREQLLMSALYEKNIP